MIYYLALSVLEWSEGTGWEDPLSFLRLFRYITVRSGGAAVTALPSAVKLRRLPSRPARATGERDA